MRAQQGVRIEIEGVVHGARRMVCRNIQRLEIVVVVLDLRPFRNGKSQRGKQRLDPPHGARDRMQATAHPPTPRQGHVDGFPDQLRIQGSRLQLPVAVFDCLLNLLFDPVDCLSGRRAFIRRQGSKLFELAGEQTLLAEVANPHRVQGSRIAGSGNRDQCIGFKFIQAGHRLFAPD